MIKQFNKANYQTPKFKVLGDKQNIMLRNAEIIAAIFPRFFVSDIWTVETRYLKIDNEFDYGFYHYELGAESKSQSKVNNLKNCLRSPQIKEISAQEAALR